MLSQSRRRRCAGASVPAPPTQAGHIPMLTQVVESANSDDTDADIFELAGMMGGLITTFQHDPNEQAWDGETALMAACVKGPHLLLMNLLSYGADPGMLSHNGSSALSVAMHYNDPLLARTLLHQGGEGVRRAALQHGLDRLLHTSRVGLEVNKVLTRCTACGCICSAHLRSIVAEQHHRLLCKEVTAWYQLQASSEDTAVAAQQSASSKSSGQLALGQPRSPMLSHAVLVRLVQKCDVAGLRRALDLGADLNLSDACKRTLLMNAIRCGQAEGVSFLLSTGRCDLKLRDYRGWTALQYAAGCGDLHATQQLIAAGCDVNARDYEDSTPLIVASCFDYDHLIAPLVAAGADLSAVTVNTETALSQAALDGRCKAISALLDAGADINSNVCLNGTALVVATKRKHLAAVKLLLSRGADPNIVDTLGCTALSWANMHGHQPIREALLRAGGKTAPPQKALPAAEEAAVDFEAITRDLMTVLIPEGRRQKQIEALTKAQQAPTQLRGNGTSGQGSAAGRGRNNSEEADRMAAQLLADEEAEKAKAQAAQAKKGKRAKHKAKAQAPVVEEGIGARLVGAPDQQEGQQQGQRATDASTCGVASDEQQGLEQGQQQGHNATSASACGGSSSAEQEGRQQRQEQGQQQGQRQGPQHGQSTTGASSCGAASNHQQGQERGQDKVQSRMDASSCGEASGHQHQQQGQEQGQSEAGASSCGRASYHQQGQEQGQDKVQSRIDASSCGEASGHQHQHQGQEQGQSEAGASSCGRASNQQQGQEQGQGRVHSGVDASSCGEASGHQQQQQGQEQVQSGVGASSDGAVAAAAAAGSSNRGMAKAAAAASAEPLHDPRPAQAPSFQMAGLSLGPEPAASAPHAAGAASAPTHVHQEEQQQQAPSFQMAGLSLGPEPAAPAPQAAGAASAPTHVHQEQQQQQQQQQQPESRQGGSTAARADERLCVICMDGPRCMVLVPCGHVVLCQTCCEAVEASNNECPTCCAEIDFAVALNL